MTDHNPMVGEIPFPVAGEGFVLRYTLSDLAKLRGIFGKPPAEMADDADYFYKPMMAGAMNLDPVVIDKMLRHGLKKQGTKETPQNFDFDDPPFPLIQAQFPILDALFARRDGKTWTQQIEEKAKAFREAAEQAAENESDPLKALDTSSGSSPQASEPE